MSSYLGLVLIHISLKLFRGERFPCDLKKKKSVSKTDLWRVATWPSALFSFLFPRPTGGHMVSLHPSPQARVIFSVHRPRFCSCSHQKRPQRGSIAPRSNAFFFLFLVTFLFSVEVDLISELVFVLGEQELDSVMHRRASIFLRGLFSVFSRRPCANSRSFGIIHLIISSVYLLNSSFYCLPSPVFWF